MKYRSIKPKNCEKGIPFMSRGDARGKSTQQGFTLIEMLMAIVILSIGLLGIARMQIGAINGNAIAYDFSQAAVLAQDQIEGLMTTPFDNVVDGEAVDNGFAVTWTVNSQTDFNGDGTADVKSVIITVDDPTGERRISLTFLKTADL